eukprot:GHVU01216011.1.p3 GENE.GHVU01216011.1~~GHVU01216011.1.p3  ORF type:complete len:121 (+),score=6.76 GHVU01216011.1:546-908(+)
MLHHFRWTPPLVLSSWFLQNVLPAAPGFIGGTRTQTQMYMSSVDIGRTRHASHPLALATENDIGVILRLSRDDGKATIIMAVAEMVNRDPHPVNAIAPVSRACTSSYYSWYQQSSIVIAM